MKPDPLDKVLREFQVEMDLAKAHETSLHMIAAALLNPWRQAINHLILEMNAKLVPYSLRLTEAVARFPDDGRAADAALVIHAVHAQSIYDDKNFPHLAFTLTQDGLISPSMSYPEGAVPFEARDLEPDDSFPEDNIRQILADYVGYCLRHRVKQSSYPPPRSQNPVAI